MEEPQNDLIEQIISASLAKQSALRDKAPAGDGPLDAPDSEDGHPDAPGPEEAPPKAREQPPPKPEQPKAEPPKAGKALAGLTAALAVAAAALLIVCLVQFRAYENTVAGLRDAAAGIQSIDRFQTENQQLRQELDKLQQALTETQSELSLSQSWATSWQYDYSQQLAQNSGLWICLVAREIYATGDPEGCAATLKMLLNNTTHLTDKQSFIRGKNYSLWEMMTGLVEKLRAEGYLSQEDADSINDKFSEVQLEDVLYRWRP